MTLRDGAGNQVAIFTHMKTRQGGRRCPDAVAATARLCAAAPELYEALAAFERVVDLWLPADSEVDVEHYGEAEALAGLRRTMVDALAKARGEQ